MYILLHFIHVGYIYICHYTFLRIPMPHTPTSFRPPSLWPQVKRMITRGTPHFRNPPDAEVTPGVSCRFDPFSQRQAGRWISDQFLLEMVNEMRFHGTLMVLSDSVGMMT